MLRGSRPPDLYVFEETLECKETGWHITSPSRLARQQQTVICCSKSMKSVCCCFVKSLKFVTVIRSVTCTGVDSQTKCMRRYTDPCANIPVPQKQSGFYWHTIYIAIVGSCSSNATSTVYVVQCVCRRWACFHSNWRVLRTSSRPVNMNFAISLKCTSRLKNPVSAMWYVRTSACC